MGKEIVKEYTNGEITIVWKPRTCIHSTLCVQKLPDVYNPKERPWIKPEKATTEELIAQLDTCPSGALSYYYNDGRIEKNKETTTMETKVEIKENGPLLVYGALEVYDKDGNCETKKRATAFCRCGVSANKPYCDGSHVDANFLG